MDLFIVLSNKVSGMSLYNLSNFPKVMSFKMECLVPSFHHRESGEFMTSSQCGSSL